MKTQLLLLVGRIRRWWRPPAPDRRSERQKLITEARAVALEAELAVARATNAVLQARLDIQRFNRECRGRPIRPDDVGRLLGLSRRITR